MKWECPKYTVCLGTEAECAAWLCKATQEGAGHSNSSGPSHRGGKGENRRKKREREGKEGKKEEKKEGSEQHGNLRFALNFKPNIEVGERFCTRNPRIKGASYKTILQFEADYSLLWSFFSFLKMLGVP